MADASIDINATNVFGFGPTFQPQTSSKSEGSTNVTVMDANGNVSCEKIITDITEYTQSVQYCEGGGPNFVSDLGTFLTECGNVQNGFIVTDLSINMTATDYCTVDVTGHQHDTNPHVAGIEIGYADVSDALPHDIGEAFEAWNGFGVPDFGINVGTGSSPSSASVSITFTHQDAINDQGKHLVGKNITPRIDYTMDYSGIPTSNTKALIDVDMNANVGSMLGAYTDSVDENDTNTEFDSFSIAAHAHTSIATA